MSVDFSMAKCIDITNAKLFGICDDATKGEEPAYINTTDGSTWIAVVDNDYRYKVTFTAIDYCIDTLRPDGVMDKRCDGMLAYENTIVFVELKERAQLGSAWIKDAEKQLRSSIGYFEAGKTAGNYQTKKAYAANGEQPKFATNQAMRMERFYDETGYVFRIERRIILT